MHRSCLRPLIHLSNHTLSLSFTHHPIHPQVKEAHKAEVVTYLKGSVIRCAEETPDMYASIDAVTDRLAQKLKKYKEKRLEGYQSGTSMGENLARVIEALEKEEAENEAIMAAASSDEDFEDPEAPVITNIKR